VLFHGMASNCDNDSADYSTPPLSADSSIAMSAPAAGSTPSIRRVPVDLIRPGRLQARKRFDAEALAQLAESIRESGIVQPLVLRGDARGYELLAGERRWRAAQLAGLHEVPAIVRNDLSEDEAEVLGLIENLQREALSPIETAAGLEALGKRYQLTHEAIGARIGKSRAYVSNHLRLLALDAQVQRWVDDGELSLGHAKVLAGLPASTQREWARQSLREHWSVRVLERRLATSRPRRRPLRSADLARLERELADHLGYPLSLEARRDGRGQLRIRFHSLDELDGLLARLGFESE
jgi:ParB family chromosome partitioning protein